MTHPRQRILLAASLVLGALITYVDSRPTWDDTGITAGVLFITGAIMGFFGPRRPWLWALALGVWIPLLGIVLTHNHGSALALVVSLAGAYAGAFTRKLQS